jgi:hypothetical protein
MKSQLQDFEINIKIKLAFLWAATTFCYIYCDYFELYVPGKLSSMLDGKMGPLGQVTQNVLMGASAMLAIPCIMVFLSIALKPNINRWLNILFGLFFTAVMVLAIRGMWNFYIFFGLIEIALTLLIVWNAWKWPKQV